MFSVSSVQLLLTRDETELALPVDVIALPHELIKGNELLSVAV
jgi:hypothetical protein